MVAAALTMRPDLLDGVIIGYPVLDMLRFHRLHVGRAWVPEYGDPENPWGCGVPEALQPLPQPEGGGRILTHPHLHRPPRRQGPPIPCLQVLREAEEAGSPSPAKGGDLQAVMPAPSPKPR